MCVCFSELRNGYQHQSGLHHSLWWCPFWWVSWAGCRVYWSYQWVVFRCGGWPPDQAYFHEVGQYMEFNHLFSYNDSYIQMEHMMENISIRPNRCLHMSMVYEWQQWHDLYRLALNIVLSKCNQPVIIMVDRWRQCYCLIIVLTIYSCNICTCLPS